jgi:hypothetical protein
MFVVSTRSECSSIIVHFLLFNDAILDALTSSYRMKSNDNQENNNEGVRIWGETNVTYFKVLSQAPAGWTEKSDETSAIIVCSHVQIRTGCFLNSSLPLQESDSMVWFCYRNMYTDVHTASDTEGSECVRADHKLNFQDRYFSYGFKHTRTHVKYAYIL